MRQCRRSRASRRISSRWQRRLRREEVEAEAAALVRRIVREATGTEPRELRFLRHDARARRLPDARPRRHSPPRRGAPARQRDRGADPARAAGHRRRDSSYGAVKLCMFTPRELALERGWPGRIEGDRVIQLAAQTLQSFFTGGGSAREHAEYALADVDLRPPVLRPPTRPRLHGLRGARRDRAQAARLGGPARVVRDPGLLLLEPDCDLRA